MLRAREIDDCFEGVQRYGAQVPGESRTPTPWILDDDGEQGAPAPVASCTLRADLCGVVPRP